eukprot:5712447-Amphidinium_carterae.2
MEVSPLDVMVQEQHKAYLQASMHMSSRLNMFTAKSGSVKILAQSLLGPFSVDWSSQEWLDAAYNELVCPAGLATGSFD